MLLETLKAQEAVEHNGLQIKTTPIFRLGVIPLLLGGRNMYSSEMDPGLIKLEKTNRHGFIQLFFYCSVFKNIFGAFFMKEKSQ